MSEVTTKAEAARKAAVRLAQASGTQRDAALEMMAQRLIERTPQILAANEEDMNAAREDGTAAPLLDRLMLTEERIADIAEALRTLAKQPDPLGEVVEGHRLYNGIELTRVRVPLGVVAMIYEARPNVTADCAGLCIKTGNACILRGGSMAVKSNLTISNALSDALGEVGLPSDGIQSIEDTSHDATDELMSLHGLVDVLIPRGGAGLINYCVENAKVPVIETGVGNCHVYVHEAADPDWVVPIIVNAKTQRPGVCNAIEGVLIDASVADDLLPDVLKALAAKDVRIHADEQALRLAKEAGVEAEAATEKDWGTEYLDLEISIKCVDGLDEAIEHINTYGTGHSECIISSDAQAIKRFTDEVDAAAVYSNASTRFTDGGEFGLGAEIGISTQKLHARGPMGLDALTSTKFVLAGEGQIRE
ncbi:MAG: glutamate-5-semialdehyde dehydrogenase [Coriobacteriaceae bacterium]|nr:glutamate-5-semialdehyde dehydrogenase [Coriobacteriaceae bacterium]